MRIGMLGLGRMGGNMALRLLRAGHHVVAYDVSAAAVEAVAQAGAKGITSLAGFREHLEPPRAVWLMLPAGQVTEDAITALGPWLDAGDLVVDGGNSWYKDDVRRAQALAAAGIRFMDVGVSGGVWGRDNGYCLMAGGDPASFAFLEPILKALAPGISAAPPTPGRIASTADEGYIHAGPVGSGHFVKMIHNGIEYGMMQAFAEGFDIMANAGQANLPEGFRYELRLEEIAEAWRRGSVVRSWLLDLASSALAGDPDLSDFSGVVADSGEGRWTIQAAMDEAVSADVLAAALFTRFRSRRDHTFAEKLLSAMRKGFGGHQEPR